MTHARVNGELLGTPRKPRPEHYEHDIDWLLNDAAGLLGEAGISYGESSGSRVPVDTGPYHARMHKALWAVSKARRLTTVWRALDSDTQTVLAARYAQKRWPPLFVAHFGELVGVVVHLHAEGGTELTKAAGQHTKANAAAALAKALGAAQEVSRVAHQRWREQYRKQSEEWAEGQVW